MVNLYAIENSHQITLHVDTTLTLYLVSLGVLCRSSLISCFLIYFSNDTSYEQVYKHCHDRFKFGWTTQLSKQTLVHSTSRQFRIESLSWMIECLMVNHLVSDNNGDC